MRGCKYCYDHEDEGLNVQHKKCDYCVHRHCEKPKEYCPCACHWFTAKYWI